MNRSYLLLSTLVCASLLSGSNAHAYVDPGTGSLLIQWALGIAMASFATLAMYWQRAKGFLRRKFDRAEPGQERGESADPSARD
jgi:hypothetical protein